jgi:protein SCO1/2
MSTTQKILAALLVLTALVGGTVFMYQGLQSARMQPAVATIWPTPKPLPEFSLLDHSGNEFTTENLRGQWSLVFFGFTHCPDICPATLQQLAIARSRLKESGKATPNIILVSVDPERDTPDVIGDYVSHFGSEVIGVTGDISELTKLTSAGGIFFAKSELPDGSYSVDHSAAILLINDDGAIYASFSAPHNVDSFVNDVPILMGSR